MQKILAHNITFGVIMVLGIACVAFLIYLSVVLSKRMKDLKKAKTIRNKAERNMYLSIIGAVLLTGILVHIAYKH